MDIWWTKHFAVMKTDVLEELRMTLYGDIENYTNCHLLMYIHELLTSYQYLMVNKFNLTTSFVQTHNMNHDIYD